MNNCSYRTQAKRAFERVYQDYRQHYALWIRTGRPDYKEFKQICYDFFLPDIEETDIETFKDAYIYSACCLRLECSDTIKNC